MGARGGSTATHTILVTVKQTGIDQVNTSIKGLATTSQTAVKSTDALGSSWNKVQVGAVKLDKSVVQLDKSTTHTTKSTQNYGKAADQAGAKTQGFAQKFQGNRGLIFGFVGLATAGLEAVGMFSMYQSAAAKVAQAQDVVNQLEQAGMQHSQAYKNATNDLQEAQRGLGFVIRNVALSFGDLIPFTLMLITQFVKIKSSMDTTKPAFDALSQSVGALGSATGGAASGGFTELFNSAGKLTGGLGQVDTTTVGLTNTVNAGNTAMGTLNTSTGALSTGLGKMGVSVQDNTKWIGTKSSGLVGGISALTLAQDDSNKMSTKFHDAWNKIVTSFKNLPSTFEKIGTSIKTFFTDLGSHIMKIPSYFAQAGHAVAAFGKSLATFVVGHPILLFFAAIATAVSALVFDLGGFRTQLNRVGVALGNIVPALKPILNAIGGALNPALEGASKALGVNTDNLDRLGNQARKTAMSFDPLLLAMSKTFVDIGEYGEKLSEVEAAFKQLDQVIMDLGKGWDIAAFGTVLADMSTGWDDLWKAIDNAVSKIGPQTDAVKQQIENLRNTVDFAQKSSMKWGEAQAFVGKQVQVLKLLLLSQINALEQNYTVEQQNKAATDALAVAQGGLSEQASAVALAMIKQSISGEKVAGAMDKNAEAVKNYLSQQGYELKTLADLTEADETWYASLYKIAPALDTLGQYIVKGTDNNVNWVKTIENMVNAQKNLEAQTNTTWAAFKSTIDKYGVEGLRAVQEGINVILAVNKELGTQLQKQFDEYVKQLQEEGKYVEYVGEKEKTRSEAILTYAQKQKQAENELIAELKEKAEYYNVLNGLQDKSVTLQQAYITVLEEEDKNQKEITSTMAKLAVQRGMEGDQLTENTSVLRDYVATHGLLPPTLDEINSAITELIAKRQEDAKNTQIEAKAQEYLLGTMEKIPPVLGMSAKGLESLVKIYDETSHATEIAADSVGLWYAELEKSQAVEKKEREILLDFAEAHKVTIPNAIKQGSVEQIKTFIKEAMGMGDAAEKAAEKVTSAFSTMASRGKEYLEGILSDQLGEDGDEVQEAIAGIEQVGISLDDVAAQQYIISMYLDDKSIENDIISLEESMTAWLGKLSDVTSSEAQEAMDLWFSTINDQIGEQSPQTVFAMQQIWHDIATDPELSKNGDLMISTFLERVQDPARIQEALKRGVVDPVTGELSALADQGSVFGGQLMENTAQGYKAGGHLFAKEGQAVLYELIYRQYGKAAADAYAQSKAIGEQSAAGISSAKGAMEQAATMTFYDPVTNTVKQIPVETKTGLAPMEGVFSEAFIKASAAATTQLNSLISLIQADIIRIYTTCQTWLEKAGQEFIKFDVAVGKSWGNLSKLSSSVATYMSGMITHINNWSSKSVAAINKVNSSASTLWGTMSKLSTSWSTYMSGMSSRVGNFASSCSSAFSKVKSSADTATKAVKALQSAINALKGKTITIRVNLTGPGVSYLSKGGSTLNIPSISGVSYAAGGKTWLQKTPKTIGGTHVAETFPEIITAIPLDPRQKASPLRNAVMDIPIPATTTTAETPTLFPSLSPSLSPPNTRGFGFGGGIGAGQPIQVTGDIHITNMMPDGKVLSRETKPFLLEGFSGIT